MEKKAPLVGHHFCVATHLNPGVLVPAPQYWFPLISEEHPNFTVGGGYLPTSATAGAATYYDRNFLAALSAPHK